MFSRIAVAFAAFCLVQPVVANAQLLKHRKQKDSQPPVVHVHTTNIQPMVSPFFDIQPVVAYRPPVATYQPVVQVPYVVESPVVTSAAVTVAAAPIPVAAPLAPSNHIPVRTPTLVPVAVRQVTGEVRLSNPRETEGTLYFSINSETFAINPGETRTVELDRELVVKFDNGSQKQMVYRLTEGAYEFIVSESTGWDLVKRSSDARWTSAKRDVPSTPANAIPRAAVSSTAASPTTL